MFYAASVSSPDGGRDFFEEHGDPANVCEDGGEGLEPKEAAAGSRGAPKKLHGIVSRA